MLTRSGKSFREAGTRIFQQEREAQHGIVSLLASKGPNSIKELPVEKVVPNPEQPRMTFHEETLQELAASIREHGVLQPILVRPAGDDFQIIAGERRWRASKLAGKETIPAIVERFDDATALEIALIENLQREDLSPLDEAIIYKKMTDELGYSIRNLAGKLGKDKGYVENRLRLATAPDDVREMVAARYDTLSAAYELMKIDDKRRRRSLAKRCVTGHERV
jgi:ParB family chromosome partitioning protein